MNTIEEMFAYCAAQVRADEEAKEKPRLRRQKEVQNDS